MLVSGCGGGTSQTFTTRTSTAASATTVAPPAAGQTPTAPQLDSQLKAALDPKLPDDERVALIEDGEAFRGAIPDLYKALQDNPAAKYNVVDPVFRNPDNTVTATMKLDKDGTGASVQVAVVRFKFLDGRWKIARDDLCGILRSANYTTVACG